MNLKEQLLNRCKEFVNKRLQTVQETILSNKNALQSETKSSAGDKHETGRAMLQLEMEKAGQQLAGIHQMQEILAKIDASTASKNAHLGSIIETKNTNYFLSISAGKLIVDGKIYYAISVSTPIGKLLLGKNVKDTLNFNGNQICITDVY